MFRHNQLRSTFKVGPTLLMADHLLAVHHASGPYRMYTGLERNQPTLPLSERRVVTRPRTEARPCVVSGAGERWHCTCSVVPQRHRHRPLHNAPGNHGFSGTYTWRTSFSFFFLFWSSVSFLLRVRAPARRVSAAQAHAPIPQTRVFDGGGRVCRAARAVVALQTPELGTWVQVRAPSVM